LLAQRLEHRFERDEVLDLVVDEQDLGAGRPAHCAPSATVGRSEARKGPIWSSGSTRRAAPRSIAAVGISGCAAVAGSCTTVKPPTAAMRASPAAPSSFRPVR